MSDEMKYLPIVCTIITINWKKKTKKNSMKFALLSSLNALYAGRYLKIKLNNFLIKINLCAKTISYQHRNDAGVKRTA